MPLVWSFKQQPYPLIVGITGIQGEDAPETSGPWELVCNAQSYGEAFNSPSPYYTLWAGFAGGDCAYATAAERPSLPWHIGAVLRSGTARVERVEFGQRPGSDVAQIASVCVEIAKRSNNGLVWSRPQQVIDLTSTPCVVRFSPVKCAGVRLRVDELGVGGKHPGITAFQLFGVY